MYVHLYLGRTDDLVNRISLTCTKIGLNIILNLQNNSSLSKLYKGL